MILQKTGLPTPEWQLYPVEILAVIQWMIWLPVLFAVLVLASGLMRLANNWPVSWRDAAVFLILLAAVSALPFFFQSWPQWLTPSRWSDFTWWKQTFDQLRAHFLVRLRVAPSFRDVCFKTVVWMQLGIIAGQCTLCEMLRCFCRPRSLP